MKSLYVRMCLVFCSVILISGVLGFLASNFYYQSRTKPKNDAKLTQMATDLKRFLEEHPATMEDYLRSTAALGYKILLVDEQGKESFYGHPFRTNDLAEKEVQNVLDGQIYHGIARFPSGLFITGFFDNQLKNTIGVPVAMDGQTYALFMRPDADVQFGELRSFFAILIGVMLLFSLWFMLVTVLHIVKPITRLTEATLKISRGRYDIQLYTARRDEIGQLASHFMVMSRELERTNRARQEFVANVSHEIESPLTSIQGFAHTLRDNKLTEAQRLDYLGIIEDESRRLSALGKQLLTLSSLDYDPGALVLENIDLRAQLRQVVKLMEYQLSAHGLAVRLHLQEVTLCGDANLLYQVWTNLLSNAIKYTPEGGFVTISNRIEDNRCIITVADTGVGIAEPELPMIFDRFYKADRARSDKSSGLGLSIAKAIIGSHGGEISAASRPGEGTTFTVVLPLL
ncbi:cell wall metabolism sensor histidine kinase WalK [Paenibacillus sp. NFR01]|uniref:sensor histidine kinase n=1 Tax=Paenibacillus sp. NFR01 TaxID=1566279 RepID=UPI0008BB5EE7|nr:HAMP domain-containing sensor histidine kinase [Paenibacillus sp. NFR01]SET18509.1 Signal transduction histidine kinase [Paenibacillus sp. NFR01]